VNPACEQAKAEVGNGVAAALRAVDCAANEVTAATFGQLFAPGGALGPVLTILLILYVAFFGFALMLGRTNISVRSLMPRMVTLGLVLTFATSWAAFQGIVWNLALYAPDWIATMLSGNQGSATVVFADKLDVVFAAIEQATQDPQAAQQAVDAAGQPVAPAPPAEISAFSPKGILMMGAMILLLGTVGVLVTARIGLAVLVALGPIFVVLALFPATRGLFTGWLKGVVMLALTPLFAVLAGGIMLEISVPILAGLNATPGEVALRPAIAFFVLAFVFMALMVLMLRISSKMVSGWRVFGLVSERGESEGALPQSPPVASSQSAQVVQSTAQAAGMSSPPRRIAVSGVAAAMPANDASGSDPATHRTTKVFATSSTSGQAQTATTAASPSRAQGIGNRFRPAHSGALARSSEKMK
jgi:type IV secretion system protein VirB6